MATANKAKETAVAAGPEAGTQVAASQAGLPVLGSMFEEDKGGGFEKADNSAYAIPFLVILQSGSPQCKKSEGEYIKGAEEGMLMNTVTNELIDGEKGLILLPTYYKRTFIEWAPRNSGGGFKGEHDPSSAVVGSAKRTSITTQDGTMEVDVLPNGNLIADTRTHYCLWLREDGTWSPIVVSMSSTQVKKSRQWMSKMGDIKLRNAAGVPYNPPSYSHTYLANTMAEKNDKGSWYGWKIGGATVVTDPVLFNAAKEFKRQIIAGEVKEQIPTENGGATKEADDKDIPF